MSTFLERIKEEQQELSSKLIKLRNFIGTPSFDLLDSPNKRLLRDQVLAMSKYNSILNDRIMIN